MAQRACLLSLHCIYVKAKRILLTSRGHIEKSCDLNFLLVDGIKKKNCSNKLYWQATIKLCTEMKCLISITLYLCNYLFSLQILTIQCKLACLWPSGTAYNKIKCFASSVSTFCNVNFCVQDYKCPVAFNICLF